jgi:hypothetical protein
MAGIMISEQLVDAIINLFRTSIMLLPLFEIQAFLGNFSVTILEKDMDGLKIWFSPPVMAKAWAIEEVGSKNAADKADLLF